MGGFLAAESLHVVRWVFGRGDDGPEYGDQEGGGADIEGKPDDRGDRVCAGTCLRGEQVAEQQRHQRGDDRAQADEDTLHGEA